MAVALVALLGLATLDSRVQTLIAQAMLERQPGVRGNLGSVSAGLNQVEFTDVHLEVDGALLKLPSLQVGLPVKDAVWHQNFLIRNLVAKGWTLDLSSAHAPPAPGPRTAVPPKADDQGSAAPSAGVIAAQQAVLLFHSLSKGWAFPCDVSLDGVDLDGEIILAAPAGEPPPRLHVAIKGGGLTAGREATFTYDAAIAQPFSRPPKNAAAASGRLLVTMDSPRQIDHLRIEGHATEGTLPPDLTFAANLARARVADDEAGTLELSRGDRSLATLRARFVPTEQKFAGTWKIDFRESELARLSSDRSLDPLAVSGEGEFEIEAALGGVQAVGHLQAVASNLGLGAKPLAHTGPITLAAAFAVAHRGKMLRFSRLDVTVDGSKPIGAVRSLQPFDVDEKTGALALSAPAGNWMEGELRGLPLAWLSGLSSGLTVTGSDASGEFILRSTKGEISVRSKTPLTAAKVALANARGPLAEDLDISVMVEADSTGRRWDVRWTPLLISSAGRPLAKIEGSATTPSGFDKGVALAGTWESDLEALALQPAFRSVDWIKGRSAKGEFSAHAGSWFELKGKVDAIGLEPGHALTASLSADVDSGGRLSFLVPLKISFGANVSDFSIEGKRTGRGATAQLYVDLKGENVALEHLQLLVAPLAANQNPGPGPDALPFWGDSTGRLTLAFTKLRAEEKAYQDVGGTFFVAPGFFRLEGGHGTLPPYNTTKFAGEIRFQADGARPYTLKGNASLAGLDAKTLFTAKPPHVVEGKFAVAASVFGAGRTLRELLDSQQTDFTFTSSAGIVRLLKTSVAESVPQNVSKVKDTLGALGSALGALLKVKRDTIDLSPSIVSPSAEAALNVSYGLAEIAYTNMEVTATRGADRNLRLANIALTAANAKLTGTGEITYAKDLPVAARPLSLDLQFNVRNAFVALVAPTGLLAAQNDKGGYTPLKQLLHFGGTLEKIDASQWHDLLAEVANRKLEGPK